MIPFNQKIMRKTELCFKRFFRKKEEVRGIITFYSYDIFSSKKNAENCRKSCR